MGYEENPQLANWVSTQRQEWKLYRSSKQSRLSDEKISMLNSIGFVWEAQRGGARKRKTCTASSTTLSSNKTSSSNITLTLQNKSKVKKSEIQTPCDMSSTRPWIAIFKDYLWYLDQNQNPIRIYTLAYT